MKFKLINICTFTAIALLASNTFAKDLKIGMVLPLSGPFAAHGEQIRNSVELFLDKNGNKVAGRDVKVIYKDDTGIAPQVSKLKSQELLIKDKVDILAGFGMTPSAFAVAPLATETKTPMIVMNAATSSITEKSDYIVRTSFTLPQVTTPIANWAVANGIKTVFTIVADYGPGHDAEEEFTKAFTAGGGKIVGQVRTPTSSPDFSPYMQKAKDANPDAVFVMLPAGEQGVAFVKTFQQKALGAAGIKLLSTGDLTDEDVLDAMGQPALGLITSFHYSDAHDSPENKQFVADYKAAYKGSRPNFWSVGGYDGMSLIYQVLEKTDGNADGDAFMAAAKGMQINSPRGPISIDPETRDVIQNVYIREVKKVGDILQNVEFGVENDVKDPGKSN